MDERKGIDYIALTRGVRPTHEISSDVSSVACSFIREYCKASAYNRILKIARTIAAQHIGEAIQYRTLDWNLWA